MKAAWQVVKNIGVAVVVVVLMPVVWAALALLLLGLALVGGAKWVVRRTPLPRWWFRRQVRRADRVCRASGRCAVCQLAETQASARRSR